MHKSIPLTIKAADDDTGTFTGYASVFDNVDAHGDVVRRGAFTKSIASGSPIPLLWEHGASDPRNYVGDIVQAAETDSGLEVVGKFDLDTEHGASAYRNVKGRRVSGLSIGYRVGKSVKTAVGNELLAVDLIEVSIVARGANARALVGAVKSAGRPTAPIRSLLARSAAARITETKAEPTMSDIRTTMLTKTRDTAVAGVKALLDTADAEGRDLTADEAQQVETFTKSIADCDAGFVQAKSDAAITAQAREFAAAVGAPGPRQPATGGHLAMTGKHAKALAANVVAAMPRDPQGTKALVASGSQTTSTIVLPDVANQGRPSVSVLDVLPMRVVAPNYVTLRQTGRDFFDGSPTAAGDLKPESDVTVTAIPGRLRVVAHTSSAVDKYILSDSAVLESFIVDEMLHGLRRGLEAQILTGDGEGENMTGVLNTSGIQTQTFVTDALTSVRKAFTKLQTQGYSASVVCLSALTWEGIELLSATSGATDRAVPVDPIAQRIYGVPVVLNEGMGAGVGLVIGDGAVVVDHDNVIETLWSDSAGDLFQRNQLICRQEGRFNVSVTQPAAVVQVETAD
jgi:HK97 family phage prohead protease/HK97 family phage major capsid protein